MQSIEKQRTSEPSKTQTSPKKTLGTERVHDGTYFEAWLVDGEVLEIVPKNCLQSQYFFARSEALALKEELEQILQLEERCSQ